MNLQVSRTLHLDAAACGLGGAVVVVAAGALRAPAGLDARWPLWLLGALLALYGIENAAVARRVTVGSVRALIAIDVTFGVLALVAATANPSGAVPWTRVTIGVVGAGSLAMAVLKHRGMRSLVPDRQVVAAGA